MQTKYIYNYINVLVSVNKQTKIQKIPAIRCTFHTHSEEETKKTKKTVNTQTENVILYTRNKNGDQPVFVCVCYAL